MAGTWTLSAEGRIYGPYTFDQMRTFAAEGRLAAHSLVAHSGDPLYRPASDDSALREIFATEAKPAPVAVAEPLHPEEPARFGKSDADGKPERARFLIVADMKSRSVAGLEEEIFNLGPAYGLMPQAWIVSTTLSVSAVRNTLVQKLGKLDVLFVVDTTHNKAAWFNFGPESEARIRRVWNPAPETAATR